MKNLKKIKEDIKEVENKKLNNTDADNKGVSIIDKKVNNSLSECYDKTIESKPDKINKLTNKLINAEFDTKEKQIDGRKKVLNSKTERK